MLNPPPLITPEQRAAIAADARRIEASRCQVACARAMLVGAQAALRTLSDANRGHAAIAYDLTDINCSVRKALERLDQIELDPTTEGAHAP